MLPHPFRRRWRRRRRSVATVTRPLLISTLGGVLALLGQLATALAAEAPRQSPAAIEHAAESFLRQALAAEYEHFEVSARGVDSRLSLEACDDTLEAFIPHGRDAARASTVGVRCTGSVPWTVYVRMEIEAQAKVAVAARLLRRGTVLRAGDLRLAERDVRRMHSDWFTDSESLIGLEVQRTLREGSPIRSRDVDQPLLIRRNDRIRIQGGSGGRVSITARGRALEDGREGERIRAENIDSGREVEGWVIDRGTIQIGPRP